MIEGDKRVDRWEIYFGDDPNLEMGGQGVDPPDRFEPLGPWFPFMVTSEYAVWRRPLSYIPSSL